MDKENHEPYKHYVYTIHWQRETVVTEWDVMRLAAQTELCGEDCRSVMHKVKTDMIGEVDGLFQATGVFKKVYRRLDDANVLGLTDCLRSQIWQARHGIRSVLGIDIKSYTELLDSEEIFEHTEEEDDDEDFDNEEPKKETKRKMAGCEISWGMNSLYDSRAAHEDLHFCTELLTDITCWVERRTLH